MSAGVDYAFFPHPSVQVLKTAGAQFVLRYISSDPANDANGKNLLPGECKALLGAGLQVGVVVEEGASYMLGGHAAGVAAAQHADAVVKALGMPGVPVYIACDFDAAPGQQPAINACLDGMASVIGAARVGLYGGFYVIQRALDAGKAHYAWQTPAWSGGQWDRRAHLRQGLTFTLDGASVDHDQAMFADFGQWPRPPAPAPPPPGAGGYAHATKPGDTLGALASARHMTIWDWIALQQRLDAGDAMHLVRHAAPEPGSTWRSISP